jgi:hypothetical protein
MAIRVSELVIEAWIAGTPSNIRVSELALEAWITTQVVAPAAGQADGSASIAGVYSPGTGVGHADGFATAQAFPPSHGNADGFASVFGSSITAAKATGQADGFASVQGLGGQPATGHADGFASVFSSPGGLKAKVGSGWLLSA